MNERLIEIIISSIPKILIPGLTVTIPLTIISFIIGLIIAIAVAEIRILDVPVLKHIVTFYVWVIRGTPLLVQLYVIYFGLPSVGIIIDALPSAVIAFSLNVGAYCSETIRAAILSVPKGQTEAGYCIGLNYWQIMIRIVLPQAFKVAFPPLFNSFIGLVKDTSLAANVTVLEMFMAAQRVVATTYEALTLYVEVGIFYLLFCTILTRIQDFGEKRLAKGQSV